MPIYEYACGACGHRLEKLQKINDDPLKQCPACQQLELKKLVSAAAFRLKGGGWYETDFKTGGKKNLLHGVSEDGNSSSSSGDSDSKKSDDSSKKSSSDNASSSSSENSGKSGKKADATN